MSDDDTMISPTWAETLRERDEARAEVGRLKDSVAALLRAHGEMEEELRRANAKLEGVGKALVAVGVERDRWRESYHVVARELESFRAFAVEICDDWSCLFEGQEPPPDAVDACWHCRARQVLKLPNAPADGE